MQTRPATTRQDPRSHSARPVIVYGKDLEELAGKLATIFKHYRIFGFDQVAVFEHDWELDNELSILHVPCSPEIILKAKGLEKPCVLWSTRVGIDTKKDILEFVYTILTRTSSVLLVAICATLNARFAEAIGYLVRDEEKIILWDAETVKEIQRLKEGKFPSEEEEDVDDSGIVDLQTASAATLGDF